MCNNKDSLEVNLRDRWAHYAPLWWQDARGARCAAPLHCMLSSTGSLSCRGTDPVPGMLPQGLIGTGAPVRHSRALSIYPSRSHNFPAILVNPSQSESIRLPHRQSDSVRVNSSLLHIITYYKDYIYF